MSRTVDNLIAYRILSMLVKPFDKTAAFEQGIIDAKGKVLKKANTLTTSKEKDAYTYLHRLVFSLKRLLGKLPGGSSKIASMAAAYYLIKECYERNESTQVLEERFNALIESEVILVEEQCLLEEFLSLQEDIANVTGAGVSTDAPVVRMKGGRKFATFKVSDDIFRRFKSGKKKFKRWNEYLNLEDESEAMIYDYAKKNPRGVLVLQTSDGSTKAIRFNRNGGGAWKNIQRKATNIVTTATVE